MVAPSRLAPCPDLYGLPSFCHPPDCRRLPVFAKTLPRAITAQLTPNAADNRRSVLAGERERLAVEAVVRHLSPASKPRPPPPGQRERLASETCAPGEVLARLDALQGCTPPSAHHPSSACRRPKQHTLNTAVKSTALAPSLQGSASGLRPRPLRWGRRRRAWWPLTKGRCGGSCPR